MNTVIEDLPDTLRVESNATLSIDEIEDAPVSFSSCCYEYRDNDEESPYIIRSSMYK
jgi:hypothetical protein